MIRMVAAKQKITSVGEAVTQLPSIALVAMRSCGCGWGVGQWGQWGNKCLACSRPCINPSTKGRKDILTNKTNVTPTKINKNRQLRHFKFWSDMY